MQAGNWATGSPLGQSAYWLPACSNNRHAGRPLGKSTDRQPARTIGKPAVGRPAGRSVNSQTVN